LKCGQRIWMQAQVQILEAKASSARLAAVGGDLRVQGPSCYLGPTRPYTPTLALSVESEDPVEETAVVDYWQRTFSPPTRANSEEHPLERTIPFPSCTR
jgi:hypothetical protein